MWSGPYCKLYCYAFCTLRVLKLWNLVRVRLYERIRLNLINARVLKITVTNVVCTWRCWTLPLLRFEPERMQLVYEIILLDKIWRNHVLSEKLQWNYASFNVTLIYLIHNNGILRDIFFGSRQLKAKTLGPIIFHRFTFQDKKCRKLEIYKYIFSEQKPSCGPEEKHSRRMLRGQLISKGKI